MPDSVCFADEFLYSTTLALQAECPSHQIYHHLPQATQAISLRGASVVPCVHMFPQPLRGSSIQIVEAQMYICHNEMQQRGFVHFRIDDTSYQAHPSQFTFVEPMHLSSPDPDDQDNSLVLSLSE